MTPATENSFYHSPADRPAPPSNALVEKAVASAKPARKYKASPASNSVAQLAAVLAAVQVRDDLRAATLPQLTAELQAAELATKRRLRREYQARLGVVHEEFRAVARRLVGRCVGEDYLGQRIPADDFDQAVGLGIAEAVARYDVAKANGGAVYFVTARLRFALQQLTGSQRLRQNMVGLEELEESY